MGCNSDVGLSQFDKWSLDIHLPNSETLVQHQYDLHSLQNPYPTKQFALSTPVITSQHMHLQVGLKRTTLYPYYMHLRCTCTYLEEGMESWISLVTLVQSLLADIKKVYEGRIDTNESFCLCIKHSNVLTADHAITSRHLHLSWKMTQVFYGIYVNMYCNFLLQYLHVAQW